MKFRDLPVGATFRFFTRGLLLAKTSAKTYASADSTVRNQTASPDADVIEDALEPLAPVTFDPYGEANTVEFSKKTVRLDGVFTAEHLEAVLAEMKKRKR
ncbi:hypothetical protein VAR608DRAFT_4913 [Variovorax sp. HW608]|uniref:hypothetical protein n=1 Tax=Variovorax sp. HW608 TaxID=1034889 RepID=UPI00081FCE73|nr:hypothetical protein [Variovorax sp. HW608]SCK49342.1 hypothetical protein VAR608DRAFT_4913 [Variovorax sp. HW608]